MNTTDDGFFYYNTNFPPLCIEPPENQKHDFDQSMKDGAINQFLQESYKTGLKDPACILPSGLSVGEAAVFYFRTTHDKRKKIKIYTHTERKQILHQIHSSLCRHMNINIMDNIVVFQKYVNITDICYSNNIMKHLISALKSYLAKTNMKTKGYTYKLKLVIQDISNFLQQ